MDGAFGRSSIISGKIYDKSVSVFLPRGINDAPNVMIGVSEEPSEAFHQPRSHWPVTFWVFIPCRNFGWSCRESCVFWNDTEMKLLFVYLFS